MLLINMFDVCIVDEGTVGPVVDSVEEDSLEGVLVYNNC